MSADSRDGRKKSRQELTNRRKPELGYYLIVTDTEGTERIYFNGLRDSISDKIAKKLVIKVVETENRNMIKESKKFLAELPQYAEPWIVFDKDKNNKFDKIIKEATNADINVAWSNPCIEIWFHAYFGKIPNYQDSVTCCREFSKVYNKKIGEKYTKVNNQLYTKLNTKGNEEIAINVAKNKYLEHKINKNTIPSEMLPCTTVFKLVEDIKSKV